MEAITQSMLGMFLRCPHQFERRYLRGEIIPPGGAFPRVILSEGEFRVIAKNEGKVFERPLNVVNGVHGEVEVLTKQQ